MDPMCECTYGVPFVTSILMLTEANIVQQKSLLSNKSPFSQTKIILSMTKVILSTTKLFLSTTKLLLSDKSDFCLTKVDFVRQK